MPTSRTTEPYPDSSWLRSASSRLRLRAPALTSTTCLSTTETSVRPPRLRGCGCQTIRPLRHLGRQTICEMVRWTGPHSQPGRCGSDGRARRRPHAESSVTVPHQITVLPSLCGCLRGMRRAGRFLTFFSPTRHHPDPAANTSIPFPQSERSSHRWDRRPPRSSRPLSPRHPFRRALPHVRRPARPTRTSPRPIPTSNHRRRKTRILPSCGTTITRCPRRRYEPTLRTIIRPFVRQHTRPACASKSKTRRPRSVRRYLPLSRRHNEERPCTLCTRLIHRFVGVAWSSRASPRGRSKTRGIRARPIESTCRPSPEAQGMWGAGPGGR